MNLAKHRFSKQTLRKRFQLRDGPQAQVWLTRYTRYTYEATNGLYDVDVRESDGGRSYHKNMGFEISATPIHREIEAHFRL